MSNKESSSLLMLCGALQDVSEGVEYGVEASKSLDEVKKRNRQSSQQIKDIQLKIEKIVSKNIKQ